MVWCSAVVRGYILYRACLVVPLGVMCKKWASVSCAIVLLCGQQSKPLCSLWCGAASTSDPSLDAALSKVQSASTRFSGAGTVQQFGGVH